MEDREQQFQADLRAFLSLAGTIAIGSVAAGGVCEVLPLADIAARIEALALPTA